MRTQWDRAVRYTTYAAGALLAAGLLGCAGQAPQSQPAPLPAETVAPQSGGEQVAVPSGGAEAATGAGNVAGGVTVSSLRAHPTGGSHTLDVWVVELKPCPECPPPMSCRPCAGEFITIADDASPSGEDGKVSVVVRGGALSQFEAGKRYRIEVEVDAGSPDAPTLTRVRLVRLVSAL